MLNYFRSQIEKKSLKDYILLFCWQNVSWDSPSKYQKPRNNQENLKNTTNENTVLKTFSFVKCNEQGCKTF